MKYYQLIGIFLVCYILYKMSTKESNNPPLTLTPTPTQIPTQIPTPSAVITTRSVSTNALPNMLIIQDNDYQKYIGGGSRVTAFCGPNVALIIDNNDWLTESKQNVSSLYNTTLGIEMMGTAVAGLEKLVEAFNNIVGRTPASNAPYNRCSIRIECAYLGDAGGLANHGVYGFATGPGYIVPYINSIANPTAYRLDQSSYWQLDNPVNLPIYYQHVIGYELCRNYIFPDQFTPAFKYGVNTSGRIGSTSIVPSASIIVDNGSYGWINQGFINITGCLLVADMNQAGFNYNGYSYQWLMNYMMGHLQRYIDGGKPWSNTFLYELLEWSPNNSLDNLYSGLIAKLWGSYGKTTFLKNWFACLSLLPPTNFSYVIAADNFFLASCYGAKLNLSTYFINTLRWPITAATLSSVQTLFGSPTTNLPTFVVPTQSINYLI
jgi:hypothetical protein